MFSDVYCGNLVELLEVNLTILWGYSYDWVPLEFLTLRLVHTEPPAIQQSWFRFPNPSLVPTVVHKSLLQQTCVIPLFAFISPILTQSVVFPSLMDPREPTTIVDFFQSVQLFSC